MRALPPPKTEGLDEQRRAWREDGWVNLGAALDPDDLPALRDELARWVGPNPALNLYGLLRHNVWRELPPFAALIREGRLAAMARQLLDTEDVVLFQDNLIWKPPDTRDRVEWHQDYAYWPLDQPAGVTLWVALEPADPENACLHYIPGTHLEGERCPTNFVPGSGQPLRPDLPPLNWEGREGEAVAAPLRAGEVLAHHPLLWHMSPPNLSTRHRRAWSLTFLAPEVRWSPSHAPHPFNLWLDPAEGDPVVGELFPRFPAEPPPLQRASDVSAMDLRHRDT